VALSPGAAASGYVPPLSPEHPAMALVRVLDDHGRLRAGAQCPMSDAELMHLYRWMVLVRLLDDRLMGMQRQGRIGFYAEIKGQEGAVLGAASALGPNDWLVPALREAGAGLYRRLPLRHYISQIFGNANDVSKGHAMPCHPGLREHKYLTMSSCIATQLPHAVGLAMAAQIRKEPTVVLGCLGDGATSEPDFHVAANFAGVRKAPIVFFCLNNQWAISTPSSIQTAAPTFAIKALGYGFPGIRVDGNDALAVHAVVKDAVERARRGEGPTLVEALSYRVSAHTSSDDPSRYRDESVTDRWRSERDPIARLGAFLQSRDLLDDTTDTVMRTELEAEVRDAIAAEEPVSPPPLRSLIEDVYAEVPARLEEQLRAIEPLPRQKTGGVHA
jgi:pyruvate dehydrogenase E1 component alpha subunit/2-oxoisovalerate dehydrogenase E1 component alpha subunit